MMKKIVTIVTATLVLIIMTAQSEVQAASDPCKNEVYLGLKERALKSLDTLSDREYKEYTRLDGECQHESGVAADAMRASADTARSTSRLSTVYIVLIVISLVLTFGVV